VHGRDISQDTVKVEPPIPGKRLVLSIDSTIQKIAEDALGARQGSVVILKPVTGEILAMATYPYYDSNAFMADNAGKAYLNLLNDPNKPMLNRAYQSSYPPASTFKTVLTTAILEEPPAPAGTSQCFRPADIVIVDLEYCDVPVVDPHKVEPEPAHPYDLLKVVCFDKALQSEHSGFLDEAGHPVRFEHGRDQQDRRGAVVGRLLDLPFRYDEVLVEDRDGNGVGNHPQDVHAAAEMLGLCNHADPRDRLLRHLPRELRRVAAAQQVALFLRAHLDLGNHREAPLLLPQFDRL